AVGIRRTAAGTTTELADLCGGGAAWVDRGRACRQHLPPSQLARRLVQLLQRGIHQPGRRVSDPAHQPDRGRRVREIPGSDLCADGVRGDLAAWLSLAADQVLERAAQRSTLGQRSAGYDSA